jgi:hypothetical protein
MKRIGHISLGSYSCHDAAPNGAIVIDGKLLGRLGNISIY